MLRSSFHFCAALLLMSKISEALWGLSTMKSDAQLDHDLTTQFQNENISSSLTKIIVDRLRNEEVFDVIQHAINSQTSIPTCNKHAYASLVRSCQTLGHIVAQETDLALDTVKSTFAAHLASCDLLEVGHDTVPLSCQYLLVPVETYARQDSSQEDLKACLRGMHNDHNAWTSYMNAKQNAIAICHATRVHIEKDAVIDQYRIFADIARNVSTSSWNATQEMLKVQSDIINAAEELFAKLRYTQDETEMSYAKTVDDIEKIAMMSQQAQAMLELLSTDNSRMQEQAQRDATALVDKQTALSQLQGTAIERLQAGHRDIAAMQHSMIQLMQMLEEVTVGHTEINLSLSSMKAASINLDEMWAGQMQYMQALDSSQNKLQHKIEHTGDLLKKSAQGVLDKMERITTAAESFYETFSYFGEIWCWAKYLVWVLIASGIISLVRATLTLLGGMLFIPMAVARQAQDIRTRCRGKGEQRNGEGYDQINV